MQSIFARLQRIQNALRLESEREGRELAKAGATPNDNEDAVADAMRQGLLFDELEAELRELSRVRSRDHDEALQKLQVWLNLSDVDVENPESVLDELIIGVTQDLLILLNRSEAA